MKRLKKVFLLCFLLTLSGTVFPFEVTDTFGRSLTFEAPPRKIVIAGRGVLLIANAVYLFPEAADRVIALEEITQGAQNFIPLIDPLFSRKKILPEEVGAEEIAALHPDCVLLKSYMRNKAGKPLENLGINVFYCNFENPLEYLSEIEMFSKITGNAARGMEITSYYTRRFEKMKKRISSVPETKRPSVLFLSYTQKGGTTSFNLPPRTWLQSILIESAGGKPIWRDSAVQQGWRKVGFEQIAAWDPEYIMVTSYFSNVDDVTKRLRNDPLWSSLKAVRGGKLLGFPADFFSWDQPDTRWILGFLWMGKQFYPDLFKSVDIVEDARIFYRDMYGIDAGVFSRKILPLLRGDLN